MSLVFTQHFILSPFLSTMFTKKHKYDNFFNINNIKKIFLSRICLYDYDFD